MRFLIRILIWSLAVGLVLAWLGWTPGDLLRHALAVLGQVPDALADLFGWAWPYMRQGAIIVVPVALILLLLRVMRAPRSRNRPD
ncbi:hypothetical protein CHU95_19340 [Niveispirillum lacus]|uniref:Integrase n=1 Tax=Niveispirillum lacus TaxID=1981099 RepID=A0A255YWA9_9PROT|nr:hypothetical protein [Niveispirillum lacus]OYQ32974.1 hypothetical protein CHU95_19340 [Niveispirillum lacus]